MNVSVKSIDASIQKIDHLDDDGLSKIAEYYSTAQPVLFAYAGKAALEYNNPKLEGFLVYYFCILAEAFSQEGLKPRSIDDKMIDEFEEPFFQVLNDFFDNDNPEVLEEFTDQPDLVKFMFMEISTPDEDGSELDDETATQLFVVALAMITLLSRACESAQ